MATKNKKKFKVIVAVDECKGCGRCIYACPVNALQKTNSVNTMGCVYVEYTKGCIGCGSCFYTCPEPGALTVVELEEEETQE